MVSIKLSLAVLVFLASPAHAQIHKCTADDGHITYSQGPCREADQAEVLDGIPASSSPYLAVGREAALHAEIRRLRASVEGIEAERERRNVAPVLPHPGRTEADLRAEQSHSWECRQATRSYQLSANSIKQADLDYRRHAMNVACGMQEPTQVNIQTTTHVHNPVRDRRR